jgi:hypothetical protein
MAQITPVITEAEGGFGRAVKAVYSTMLNGDIGDAIALAAYSDRAVQVAGTFGVGGNINVEGTIDGVNWGVLNDPQGVALAFTTAGIEAISELVVQIRPNCSAGDGTTDLDVSFILRK